MTATVVHFTDSRVFGGTEQVVLQLLAGLDRGRWRPVLLYYREPALEPLVAGAREIGVALRAVRPISRRSDVLGGLVPFVRALRAERAAVYHAHLPAPLSGKYGLIAAVLSGVPAVVATAHLYTEVPAGIRTELSQRLAAVCINRYIAVSNEVAMRLRARFRVPARKVQVIHNGIDPSRYCRLPDPRLRASLDAGTGRPIALCVARLDRQKGHRHLVEAAAAVPDAVFVLAGEGEERAALEGQVRALGLVDRFRFLGHRADVPDLLAACDVLILPSLFEGLPLSVLEAMAAGKPVVATAVGGTDEAVVHGETGLLVPPADPAALAAAIRAILTDPAMAERLGMAGRARVQREFSVARMTAEVSAVYESLLERRQSAGGARR
jgi:glycosyltransferase involved in cell wall biosynthesis